VFHSNPQTWIEASSQRREFDRHNVQCRARIRIANRQYAGYLHNISRGGAKLRTITPIHRLGTIILRLPDLPPLRCELRWTDHYNAGVMFGSMLSEEELRAWVAGRMVISGEAAESQADTSLP
jgi:hypothetical protein